MAKPPPIPRRKVPPPIPPATKKPPGVKKVNSTGFAISTPVQKLTVDQLVSSFKTTDLDQVVDALQAQVKGKYFSRPEEMPGFPGSLVIHDGKRKLILVGDMHGSIARLDLLLQHIQPLLDSGEAELWFLGDVIHPENNKNLSDMRSSVQMLKALVKLKQIYGDRVNLVLGNHDVVCTMPEVLEGTLDYVYASRSGSLLGYLLDNNYLDNVDRKMKVGAGSSPQAFDFLNYLCKSLKEDGFAKEEARVIIQQFQAFFDSIPLSIIVRGQRGTLISTHTVRKGGVNVDELVYGRENGVLEEILYNKRDKGQYSKADSVATLRRVKADYLMTAHEPNGNKWGYQPYKGVNHYVIHGNVYDSFGAMLVEEGVPRPIDIPIITDVQRHVA
jgi:hypothetical protein